MFKSLILFHLFIGGFDFNLSRIGLVLCKIYSMFLNYEQKYKIEIIRNFIVFRYCTVDTTLSSMAIK